MNPNQMNMAKAMVAMRAFQDEAAQSRRRARLGRARATTSGKGVLGLLRRR